MPNKKKVFSIFGIGFLGAVFFCILAGSVVQAAEKTKIRIGAEASSFAFQFRVALAAGIFEKYDLDAEIFSFAYGIDTLNATVLGETDSAEAADFAIASRLAPGSKLRIVAFILSPADDACKLYVRDDSIKVTADLKGRRIGVKKGTVNEYEWGKFFEKFGINPQEVQYEYLSSTADQIAAFQGGDIDAFWGVTDIESTVLKVPGSRTIGDYGLLGSRYKAFVLLDELFIKNNPDAVVRLVKALDEATTFIKNNPEEVADIAYRDLKIPRDAALAGIKTLNYDIRLWQEDLDQINDVYNWSFDHGLIKNKYVLSDYVYTDAIREALPDKVTVK
ncbi:MAG: ABC transporter substrate-binding protein [Deltaproteobacteria bacterium]|jgi:NitT/TauT family transport system substrate-binding protein|nr:ABC transporter substrate-binding protein [Deltaproteobacteria bacterium]